MAGDNHKKATKQEQRAAKILSETGQQLYALADFGRKFGLNSLDIYTARVSIEAIAREARAQFVTASDGLPRGHDGRRHIASAIDALDLLNCFMGVADLSDEKPTRLFRRMVGDVVLSFTAQTGRFVELAESATGGGPGVGFLSGEYLKGGADMRALSNGEHELLLAFGGLTQRGKDAARAFVKSAGVQGRHAS